MSTKTPTVAAPSPTVWLGQLVGQSSDQLEQARHQLETLLAQTKEREIRQHRLSEVEAHLAELAPALADATTQVHSTQERLDHLESELDFIEQELFEGVA